MLRHDTAHLYLCPMSAIPSQRLLLCKDIHRVHSKEDERESKMNTLYWSTTYL